MSQKATAKALAQKLLGLARSAVAAARFHGCKDLYDAIGRLPLRIRRQILSLAGLYTQLLFNDTPLPLSHSDWLIIVAELMRADRPALVAAVVPPCILSDLHAFSWPLLFVRSAETAFFLSDSGLVPTQILQAESGSIEPLSIAYDLASLHGHIHVINHFIGLNLTANISVDGAIAGGNVHITQTIYNAFLHIFPSPLSIKQVLKSDFTNVIWWLLNDTSLWRMPVFRHFQSQCASTGALDLLKFAIRNEIGVEHEPTLLMDLAAQGGHLETAMWLKDIGLSCSSRAMQSAAKGGHLAMLKWLHQEFPQVVIPRNALVDAAFQGNFEVVSWLLKDIVPSVDVDGVDSVDGENVAQGLKPDEFMVWQ
eukprot:jgi/Hompol1/45/HPOL_005208-RA